MKTAILAIGFVWACIFWAGKMPDSKKELARVNQYQGIYIFTDCTPVNDYEVLGTIKPKGRGGMALGVSGDQYTDVRDGLIKACKKDYPEADGIILHLKSGGSDASDAIKFK